MAPNLFFPGCYRAAFIHASWNILLKRVSGGLSFLWWVDILQGIVFLPWIGLVIYAQRPVFGFTECLFIVGSAVIDIFYYFFLQLLSGADAATSLNTGARIGLNWRALPYLALPVIYWCRARWW
jgi:hypothetical protein